MLLFFAKGSFSQSEEVLKADADKLFYAGKYLDATPLYLRLLSVKPRSYEYNFRYGACLIYNSNRKLESLKYLRVAALDPSGLPPEFHYFYGKSLHLSYLFNDAIKEYKLYNQTKLKETPVYEVIREIEMCENGKRLMTTITDIIVTDKKEISVDKFFRIYDLSNIGGSLLVTAEFQTKLDKKYNHTPLIHFPANPKVIYYSSYGDKGENGKDIYVRRKLPDNSWGQPQELPGEVNTPYDEDFPYMHPDGDYLYFSSKGHNTMGGYDVFRSKYDKETNMFGKPENMDFAVSSPDDDVFYVVDSLNKDAVFASSRQSQEGFLHVYKVKVDRVPLQMAVVKGDFKSMVDTSYKDIDFTIRDYSNGDFIGKFNSNEKGTYLITFPKGGKYEFVMTVNDGPQEFRSIVTIPFMKEFKPLKQMIMHVAENGVENVKIVNQFDQVVDEPADVMAEVIQKRGELNVNVNEFDMKKIEESKQTNSILAELGYGKLNNVEVAYSLQDQIKKGIENKSNIESLSNNINNLVVENTSEFLNLEEQIKQKVAASNNVTEADQKYKLLKEAKLLMEQQQELKDYSADLIGLRDSISNVLNSANSIRDLDKLKILSGQFDKLLAEGNEADALSLLASNRIMLQGILKDTAANLMENLVDRSVVFDNQIVGLNAKVDVFNRDISTLQLQIQTLQNSLEAAKSKEAEDIKSRIASKEEEIMLIEEERDLLQKSINMIRQEKYVVSQQMELLKDAISNKSLVAVSVEQSTTRLKETEKPNTNSLNSFVEQQVTEIEKKDPAIKDRVVVVNNLSAQNIYNEYKNSDQGIKDDPNLNAEARLYKMLSNERKALRMINKRLEDIAKLQSSVTSSNPQLAAEKESLENYRRELNALVQQHELDIRTVVSSKDVLAENKQGNSVQPKNTSSQPVILTPQEAIAQVDPGYQSRKDAVNSTKGLTNQQKLEALNKEDTRMLTAVNSELSAVNDQLKKTPNDVSLQKKQQALQQAKNSTDEIVQQRNKEIDAAKQVAANQNPANQQKQGPQSTITAQNESELLTQLDPEYQNRTQKITTNQGMTEAQKVEYLNAQDNKLLTTIKNEIVKVNSDATQNPTDQKIQEKKELLEVLKAKTESAIQTRNEQLIAGNTTLANSAGQNKQTEQVVEDKNAIEQQNALKPLTAEQITAQVDPTYENRSATIKANNALNAEQKLAALNVEDQKFLTSVEAELKKVTNQLAATPNDKTILERKSTLTEIKAEKQSAIAQREKEIAAAKEIAANTAGQNKQAEQVVENKNANEQQNPAKPLTAAQITTQVDPTYENRAVTINANNALNAEQKLAALNAEDQKLLMFVEAELKKVTNQLAATPNDKSLLERKSTLTEIKTEKQSAIAQREKKLVASKEIAANTAGQNKQAEQVVEDKNATEQQNLAKPLTSAQITAQVDPTYENRAATINANNALNAEQKLAALNAEAQKLLTSVEAELKKVTNQLAASPNDKTLLERKSALTEIKTEKQSAIAQREKEIAAAKEIAANTAGQNKQAEQVVEDKNANEQQNLAKPLTAAQITTQVDPTYENRSATINANNALNAEQKLAALNVEDQKLLTSVEAELKKVTNQLAATPNDKSILERKSTLTEVKTEKQSAIAQREKEIAAAKEIAANTAIQNKQTEQSNNIAQSEEQQISKLSPKYNEEIKSIENNKALTEDQKLIQIQEKDKLLLLEINKQKAEIEKSLAKNPSNEQLKKEQEQLQTLAASVEARSDEREQLIASKLNEKVTPELVEKSKLETIKAVDPQYEQNIAASKNQVGSELDRSMRELKVEQDLQKKITSEQLSLNKLLDKDPTNAELLIKKQALSELKAENDDRISLLNQDVTNLKAGKPLISVNETDKTQEVNDLNPEYAEKQKEILSSGMSQEEKNTALMEQEQDLRLVLVARTELLQEELKTKPNDREIQKELKVLEALKLDNEKRIDELDRSLGNTVVSELSPEQERSIVEKLDPTFNQKTASLTANTTLSEEQKQQELLAADQQLLSRTYNRQEEIDQQLARNPNDAKLKEEQNQLSVLSRNLESKIELRQEEVNRLSEISATTAPVKEATITTVDAAYRESVSAIVNSNKSEAEKNASILILEKELLAKVEAAVQNKSMQQQQAESPELKKELLTLSAIKQDLEKSIGEKEAAVNVASQSVTAESKSSEIARIDASFEADVKAVNQNQSLTEKQKQEQLLERESRMLNELKAEKQATNQQLQKAPTNDALKQRLAVLTAVENDLTSSISSRQANLNAPEDKNSEIDKTNLIASVQPDYAAQKETLRNSKMEESKKITEQLKLEQGLLSKLEAEKASVEKSLQKDPSNTALQKQSNLLSETISTQKTAVSSLQQQQVNVAEQRKIADAIAKVDVGYEKEMEQLSAGGNSRNTEMIEREKKHQELISKQIIENEAKLATSSNNQLKSETDALRNELQASQQREEKLKTEEQAVSAKQDVFVENFRKEQLKEQFGVVDANYTEKSELVNQDAQLAIYENQLNLAVSKQDEILRSNPSNTVEKEKMEWLKSELSVVQNKRRSIKISIGELEKVEVIAENNTDQRYNDPSLNQLNSQEAQLTNNLADNSLTKKERQGIQKELDAVQQKQAVRENELIANEIVDQKNTNEAIAKELKAEEGVNEVASLNTRATILSNESVQKEIAVLNEKVAQTKNPEEKKYILNEIVDKQEALNIQLKESLVENKIQQLQKENGIESLETEQALEAKKRRYMIQVGELSKVINELDQQIAAAKPKQAAVLIQEKELKIQQKNLVEQQITLLDKQLASKSTVNQTLSDEAMKQNVGYAEEKEIATTEVYKNYVEKALPALQLEKQITTLDTQLQQERSLSKQLIAASIDQPTEENKAKVQANTLRIAELEKELNATKQQLVNSQALANAALPKDKTEAMKMQNLLKRGVEPIQRAVLIAALVPMPASGLEINKAAVTSSMAKPIPVDVKSASGLVYRVQVGAFSKPIPQDRFREFNPVSGETLNNGITRYMAGYFNSSKNVLDARNKIRAIGYADAFAIAYCDGKRISLAEARALELSKQCLPKGENELVLEMAANTAEKMGMTISDSLTPAVEAMPIITETDYNNVPGGVKADPVENHLGLFYTVQVGVFNNPINAKVVSNMAPLISNRLPNGQIRYSSGMFNSIDEARPKKQEAIDKGIKDAFITAYYKSQRITLAEAEQLLKENGEAILESKQVQKSETNNTQVNSPNAGAVTSIKSEIKIDPSLLVSETKTIEAVQIVTKKTFDEFPREILNRYNSHGSFYYDENDKKVKSAIADSRESLPQVFYFKDDIDTVVVIQPTVINGKTVRIDFAGSTIPGDFTDWLLRFNYRREFKRSEGMTTLRIFDVPEEKVTVLLTKLEEFGLKGTIE